MDNIYQELFYLEKGTIIYPSAFLFSKAWVLPISRGSFLIAMKEMSAFSIILHYTAMPYYLKKNSQTPNQKQTGKTASCKASVWLTKVYLLYVNGSCLCYSCILIKLFLIHRWWNQNSVHGELQPPGAGLRCKNKQPSDTGSTAGQTMP